jgi:hypothetical protein
MQNFVAPSPMIAVARPQSAIVRERGRALTLQAPSVRRSRRDTPSFAAWSRSASSLRKVSCAARTAAGITGREGPERVVLSHARRSIERPFSAQPCR